MLLEHPISHVVKGGPLRPDPVVDAKVAAYPPIVQLILKACQRYGVIHTDVGFADFGIEAAYDPRCDDVLPGTEGIPYGNYNPARKGETTLGIGRGMLVDLR